MNAAEMTALIAAVAVACAGLGYWLAITVADDTGSIVLITAGCGVLGSFAPNAVRWARGAGRSRDRGRPAR